VTEEGSADYLLSVIPADAGSFAGVSIGMPIAGGTPRAFKREPSGVAAFAEAMTSSLETDQATTLGSRVRGNDGVAGNTISALARSRRKNQIAKIFSPGSTTPAGCDGCFCSSR
jgi:hypothetical protein